VLSDVGLDELDAVAAEICIEVVARERAQLGEQLS
jgi:hypothetical protein